MPQPTYQHRRFDELIRAEDWSALVRAIQHMDPADTADLLEEFEPATRDRIFRMLDAQVASDVLVEMEPPYLDDVVEELSAGQLADLADRMAPDDAVRILSDIDDEERSAEVLAGMKEREDISELLRYQDDSAGQLMTTEFVAFDADTPIREVREALVTHEPVDPVFYVYALDSASGRLLGLASVKTVFTAGLDARLGDTVETQYVYCGVDDDQEDVAHKFRKYDVWVMPVVDEHHRLVGRITADDIMDVLHEEADEDLAAMVGAPDIEKEEDSPIVIARLRLPWLLVTLATGLVNSVVLKSMLNVTANATLAIFIPAIMAMGGNTGMQSAAITVRGLALGQQPYKRLWPLMGREMAAGAVMGAACGLATGVVVYAVLAATGADTGGVFPARLAVTVAVAMFCAMSFASCFGTVVPMTLHRLGTDPAVAAGPFVTTSNDLSASLIYFSVCFLMLGGG
jgi:magnesium transporter